MNVHVSAHGPSPLPPTAAAAIRAAPVENLKLNSPKGFDGAAVERDQNECVVNGQRCRDAAVP